MDAAIKTQDRNRSVLGKLRAPPCGSLWKLRALHIFLRKEGKKQLRSCCNMSGISSAYVSYVKNMWIYINMCPLLHPSSRWDKEGQISWLFTLEPFLNVVFRIRALERQHHGTHLADPFQPYHFCDYHLVLYSLWSGQDQTLSLQCTGEKTHSNTHLKTWGRYNILVFHIPSHKFQISFYLP